MARRLPGLLLIVCMIPLVLLAAFCGLWTIVCFLGGPHSEPGSLEPIEFGLLFAVITFALLAAAFFVGRAGGRLLGSCQDPEN